MALPKVKEIAYCEPSVLFPVFLQEAAAVLLESTQQIGDIGRYSFIAYDPFLLLTSKEGQIELNQQKFSGNPFDVLQSHLAQYPLETIAELPPFQGGVMGFFSYDLYHHLERLTPAKQDVNLFPDLAVGFYDVVIAFDHQQKKSWIICQKETPALFSGTQRSVNAIRLLKNLSRKNLNTW